MRAIGIVLAGGNSKRMRELSNKRAISAMPVAGSYRSIDFALSSMSNAHVQKVAVLTQYNAVWTPVKLCEELCRERAMGLRR